MKNIFICLLALFAFSACTDDDEELLAGGGSDIELLPENKPNDVINENLFSVINLDYPGLEKVKEHYEAKEYYLASKELLKYYRERTDVINPNVNLMNVSITDFDQNVADQALDYRFYVRGFKQNIEEEKEIYYSFLDDKDKINWAFIPDKITNNEFKYQTHRHQWMLPQAKAYRVTRNEEYAESWIKVYSDWISKRPQPDFLAPEGGSDNDVDYEWKGLQVAERVISQIDIMQYFMQSIHFTPEWLSVFLSKFAEQVECIRSHYYTDGNILVTQAQAVALAGILMPEFKNAESWVTDGAAKLNETINKQFLSDGMHYELDLSYHVGAISDFRITWETAKLNNKEKDFPYIAALEKPAEMTANLMYPDYSVENFNDTRSARLGKSVLLKNFKSYAELFPNNNYLKWMANEGTSGSVPGYFAKAYEASGYYILRNGWDKTSTMMILKNNNNPDKHWHCQPDNGTFGIYRNGRNFFPDAGSFAYSGDPARETYRQTKFHNTMTANSANIEKTEGKLLKMETIGTTELVVTENESFTTASQLTHRRAVFFVNREFFVIVDEGYGEGLQSGPKANLNFNLCPGSEVILDLNKTMNNAGAHTTFSDNNMILRTFVPTTSTSYEEALIKGAATSNDIGVSQVRPGYQITIRKISNGAARYITVIYFADDVTSTNISGEFTDEGFTGTGASVKVTIDGREYPLTYTLN